MRAAAIVAVIVSLAAPLANASACAALSRQRSTAGPHWTLDHYVYDASLRQDWEVLVDCNHREAPAQMKLASGSAHILAAKHDNLSSIAIYAGTAVEVSSSAGAPAVIHLSATAAETAFLGQPIRVRLSANGHFVTGLVRGPHLVELVAASRPSWRKP